VDIEDQAEPLELDLCLHCEDDLGDDLGRVRARHVAARISPLFSSTTSLSAPRGSLTAIAGGLSDSSHMRTPTLRPPAAACSAVCPRPPAAVGVDGRGMRAWSTTTALPRTLRAAATPLAIALGLPDAEGHREHSTTATFI
jgi:hypothetical protein